MKKISLLLCLSLLSFNTFAVGVYFDSPNCFSIPGENLGGCFVNKTGMDVVDDLRFVGRSLDHDGATQENTSPVTMHKDHYMVVSWSSDEMVKKNLTQLDFALMYRGQVLPNCVMHITPNSWRQPTFVLLQTNNQLHC